MRIARRFNAGNIPHDAQVPKGRLKDGVGLEFSRPFGTREILASNPALKRWAIRLSLRDSKAAPAVFPCRQDGPDVQQYDLWVMTSPLGEWVPEGRVRGIRCGSRSRCAICKLWKPPKS